MCPRHTQKMVRAVAENGPGYTMVNKMIINFLELKQSYFTVISTVIQLF